MARRQLTLVLSLLALFLGAGGCSTSAPAQDSGGRLLPEQAAYDVTHYDLSVRPNARKKTIEGTLRVHAVVEDSLHSFVLNLDRRLDVRDVWSARAGMETSLSVERRSDRNEVWISLAETRSPGDSVEITVEYGGAPRVAPRPPWDGGFTWAETSSGAPWIATSCQTAGADLWWPVKDHPSDEPDSMDIAITVPDTLVAASNGRLRAVDHPTDSTETYRWHVSTPINAYTVALNVGPYVHIDTTYASTSGQAVPVSFYALPRDRAEAKRVLPEFLDQVRFLEETLGPYPFREDKYGIAQTPFLGMEHQSIIAYGHTFEPGGLGYDASYDALHFHELAHEWYGNLVTVGDWKDFWLHEGTATYLEALYAESLEGDSAYHAVTDYQRSQIAGGRPIARKTPTPAQFMYHRDVYYRGAQVLHTLRYVVGEEAIREILRRFIYPEGEGTESSSPFRSVSTRDFVRLAEQVTGRSLDAFFQVYLYQAELPRIETEPTGDGVELRWVNTGDVSFDVPVPVRVDGEVRRVSMSGGDAQLSHSTDEITIDPDGWILRAE